MPALYVLEQGAALHKESRRLKVMKNEMELQSIPLFKLEQVVIYGNIGITTPALRALLKANIDVIFLDIHGRYQGRLIGQASPQVELRIWQYRRADDSAFTLRLAQELVQAKLTNMRTFFMRYLRRDVASIPEGQTSSEELRLLIHRAAAAPSINHLLGIEGRGSAIYFRQFRHLLTNEEFGFRQRIRRPPTDPVNALLSFGYTLLAHQMESVVRSIGLDPYIGFLHGIAYNRPSLALDLIEEFRAIVIDSTVLRCLNEALLTPAHFQRAPITAPEPDEDLERDEEEQETETEPTDDREPSADRGLLAGYPIWLTDEGKAIFLRELENRLNTEFQHPLKGERVNYRRCFELQAREMARSIREGTTYRPFLAR